MIRSLLAKWRLPPDPLLDRDQRFFRALRYAAGHTRFYSSWKSAPRATDAAAVLPTLPPVDLLDYLRHPERFRAGHRQRESTPPLRYPLGTPPRTAVLGEPAAGGVRWFAEFADGAFVRYAPEALAGHCDTIRGLADAIDRGEAPPPRLRHALVVYTDLLRGPLAEADRDRFWRSFEVPVFEQFRGFDNEVLAEECEVHHGLHIELRHAWFEEAGDGELRVSFLANRRAPVFRLSTNLTAHLAEDPCPCGRPTPRLIGLRRRAAAPPGHRHRAASS